MNSIKTVYKVGNGPSSSHTVGPFRAAKLIGERFPEKDYRVTLFGSLALTGSGHGTQRAILTKLPNAEIVIDKETNTEELIHPNTMQFEILKDGQVIDSVMILSVGGGSIKIVGEESYDEVEIYPHKNFEEIHNYCVENNLTLAEYVYAFEGEDIKKYLRYIWRMMTECVENGLKAEGTLPGGLNLQRKAKSLLSAPRYNESRETTMFRTIFSYAYAVSEENASEHTIVTAPTCGSAGVLPAILYYQWKNLDYPLEMIIDALATAGVIGNVIRTNASVSGAECGCQAEIGSACSMAAAALASTYGMNIDQIECAAEIAMEHNLGLTCDPVKGLVQIPCIERNAVAASRAYNCAILSNFLYKGKKISFDSVVETMYRTGLDMSEAYKETSYGGLAVIYKE